MFKDRFKDRFAHSCMRLWMRRGWFARVLWPLSQIFALVLALRVELYRLGWFKQRRLTVPVIVVGNIFIGGTGKTPFTLWLLEQLKCAGYQPGVISRGYGGKHVDPCVVSADSLVSQVGDEPLLLAQRGACPVVVGRNRVKAGQQLLATFPRVNVIISDDGLQHLALARDVEIMLFDARGVGNGWLLPAGPLREPISRRRDITVVNVNSDEQISPDLPTETVRMQLTGSVARQLSDTSQIRVLTSLNAELNIVAAAGIGNPERFFNMLRQQGVRCSSLALPDHFDYQNNPFQQCPADMILITEKDAVKCRQLPDIAHDRRIWVVAVQAEIDQSVTNKILQLIKT